MTTTKVDFSAKSGGKASGELAIPDGTGKGPALILIHEWWGLNDHIRSIAERLAKEQIMTLAVDLYHGKVTEDPNEAMQIVTNLDGERSIDEIAGAVTYLASHERSNGKVGIIGFCLGGAFAFRAAANIPELAAAVPFYGVPPAEKTDYTKVRAPIQAHFAAQDQFASPEKARAIKEQMDARGQPMELHIYDANHAFMNDSRADAYNPAAASLAWERMLGFLRRHLA
jgi:carboxymethylenebutenolidase